MPIGRWPGSGCTPSTCRGGGLSDPLAVVSVELRNQDDAEMATATVDVELPAE